MNETRAIFIDTCAHLDFPEYEGELEAVIERTHQAVIDHIVTSAPI
ncbi:MAG: hypothetical protein M2R45_04318 [Verrucomicrobia subdivision 3 bacterium]|nr:hypothetical protein [Limisphaerales bacterium]MCS1417233.1 hypothetical protein [Limisphaerales bacterium]